MPAVNVSQRLLLALLLSSNSYSHEACVSSDENCHLPLIMNDGLSEVVEVTAYRTQHNLDNIPGSIVRMNHETLQDLQANTLSELFRNEPSIHVDKSGSRFGDANITIRGIGGNRVLVLKDGVRMPDGFGSAGTDQARGSFTADSLESIQILKGASSAQYGSDAMGGVLILNTLSPEDLLNQQAGNTYARMNMGYSSLDQRVKLGLTTAARIGKGAALFQVETQRFSETATTADTKPDPQNGAINQAMTKYSFRPSTLNSITLSADFWQATKAHKLKSVRGPVMPPGSAITQAMADDLSERWHLGIKQDIADQLGLNALSWQLDYQASVFRREDEQQIVSPHATYQELSRERFEQRQFSFSSIGYRTLGSHHISIGTDNTLKTLTRPRTEYSLSDTGDVSDRTRSKTFPDASTQQYGVFIQDAWQITPQWGLLTALRYDYFRSQPSPDTAYWQSNPSGTAPKTMTDDHVSPFIGLTYSIHETTQLYANYNTGFRAPPVDKQFASRAIIVPGFPHEIVPNAALKSEYSRGYEAGLRWHNEDLSLSLAYFNNNYDDFIETRVVGTRDAGLDRPVTVMQYTNIDRAMISGWEFNSKLAIDTLLPTRWQGHLSLGASMVSGENSSTGQGLNSIGPDSAVLGLSINPRPSLRVILTTRAYAKASDAAPFKANGQTGKGFEPPGYVVHDATINWQPRDNLQIIAAVNNLTNRSYWGAYMKGADPAGNLDAQRSPGRYCSVSMGYRF